MNELHCRAPEFRCVYLTWKPLRSANYFLKDLDFKPFALGMHHLTIRRSMVKNLNSKNIETYSWTVNSPKKAKKVERKGVKGIIPDFPDTLLNK